MVPANSFVPPPSASALDSTQAKTLSVPLRTIHTTAPVWRARFLPFGSGLLSLPQAVETALDMWAIDSPPPDATSPGAPHGGEIGPDGNERVIKTFVGHSAKVKEFVWRTRGGADLNSDDRSFQLITWGTDQTLRFWPIEEKTMIAAGHKPGAPIKVIMTRRGAKDESCIEEPPVAPVLSSSPGCLDGSTSSFSFDHAGPHGYPRRRPTEAVVSAPLPHVIAGVRPLRHPFESGSSSDGSSTMGSGVARHLSQTPRLRGSLGSRKKKKKTPKRQPQAIVMTRGTTGISMVTKTDASTAAQNWNENVNVSRRLSLAATGQI